MEPRRPTILGLCLIVSSLHSVQSSVDGLLHSSAVSRMLSSMDLSDQEVDLLERNRREVARDRDMAGICQGGSNNGSFPVGCVMEGTIPEGETYIVHFKHDESGDDPSICWQTCQAVFPNTSLALVVWQV